MASILFLLLKSCRVIDTSHDLYWFSLLMALEIPGYLRILLYWLYNRRA